MGFMKSPYIQTEEGRIIPLKEVEVTISTGAFTDLIRKAEKIDAVKRIYDRSGYLCTDDVLAILEIEKKEEEEND